MIQLLRKRKGTAATRDPSRVEDETPAALLELGLSTYERKIHARLLARIASGLPKKRRVRVLASKSDRHDELRLLALRWLRHLEHLVGETRERLYQLRRREAEFNIALAKASSDEDRNQVVLAFGADFARSRADAARDRRALSRWLGPDAIKDRFTRRLCEAERDLAFYLGRLGALAAFVIGQTPDPAEKRAVWSRIGLEALIKPLLAHDGDVRVVTAAFRALARALTALPSSDRETCVDEATLQYIYRSALQSRQDVWVQAEAIALLGELSIESASRVLEERLARDHGGDDFFVRRRAVKTLIALAPRLPKLSDLVNVVLSDPSPFVRQALAEAIHFLPRSIASRVLLSLAFRDPDPKVRAAAVWEIRKVAEPQNAELLQTALECLVEVLAKETDSFVLRTATRAAVESTQALRERSSEVLATWGTACYRALDLLHASEHPIPVRRQAAQAREAVWCALRDDAWNVLAYWRSVVGSMNEGGARVLSARPLRGVDHDLLGRALSVQTQNDFGLDVRTGRLWSQVQYGFRFGFRWWRFIHEMRHPSPDKRQAHRHTIGRVYSGDIRAPSAVLAELAETKVPGEPLFLGEEAGWRPFLPLVDDLISVSDQWIRPRPVKIYTSEGVTLVRPPANALARLRAAWLLSWRFQRYARLRNWKQSSGSNPRQYTDEIRKLGFQIELHPHEDRDLGSSHVDPDVTRFFAFGLPLLGGDLLEELLDYAVSVYENTLLELTVFAGIITAIFCGRHFYSNITLRRARNKIPLVIGGWGTRGKSGTERIKAGLISELGYGYVSKTTGCEAMFLFAHPFGKTKEMFLFRPYDKATIWEQRNVVRFAAGAGVDAFLWECMGLTPSYVQILQKQWMRDDLSTITNTYPDHEDLQGPAGIDIPHVMCEFIPRDGYLFTTEEQMLPILRQGARSASTVLETASWLEAGLLTNDVLERFPYDEHPYNIALVLELARELGVEKDFALKAMADRVVADLGVLKTYPPARVRDRIVEFVNGMSANERHGALGNWTRLGFDKEDALENADTWIVTVINNRADRIARSRVFADMVVRDVSADRHVLIGNNLLGLQGYIKEAWDAWIASVDLFEKGEDGRPARDPITIVEENVKRHRLPLETSHIARRLQAMLRGLSSRLADGDLEALIEKPDELREKLTSEGLGRVVEEILEWLDDMKTLVSELDALRGKLRGGARGGALEEEFRDFLWRWYRWKIIVVEDYFATGEEVVERVARSVPPGLRGRVLGMQNIKGTGLDFVYRFQAWDKCFEACRMLRSSDPREAEQGIRELTAFQEFGLLSEEHVRETLETVRRSPAAQRETIQSALVTIEANLTQALEKIRQLLEGGGDSSGGGWLEKVCGRLEEFLDTGDAVRRRKTANRIYKDLLAERIGIDRAALELLALTKRQKGGWLYKQVKTAHESLMRSKVLGPWRR